MDFASDNTGGLAPQTLDAQAQLRRRWGAVHCHADAHVHSGKALDGLPALARAGA